MKIVNLILLILISFLSYSFAEDQAYTDGKYEATVTMNSNNYSVPVEVEDDRVTQVDWSNQENMSVEGAELSDSEADGTGPKGESVHIALKNSDEPMEDQRGSK